MHCLYRDGESVYKIVDYPLSQQWVDQYNKMSYSIPIQLDPTGTVIKMPYINGVTPSVKKHGRLISVAIEEMINEKFIHRDLDPANMLIKDEQLIIIDPDSWIFSDDIKLHTKLAKAAYNGNTIRFYGYSFAINNRWLFSLP